MRLDQCCLLPGLINAHTHLEFSDLQQPLPAGDNFPQWIAAVLAARQQTAQDAASRARALQVGLDESLAAGVVALADIISYPWQPSLLSDYVPTNAQPALLELDSDARARLQAHLAPANAIPQVIAFIEQLGLSPERRQALIQWRQELLQSASPKPADRLMDLAFSPHAPYSTPPQLWQELCGLAAEQQRILAMHLLESPAEREWLDAGTGPMADMLSRFNAGDYRLPRDFVSQLSGQLSRAKSALLIHGNYLSDSELACIAEQREHFSLVYCPRTHAHFGHQPYPLAQMLKYGLRVLIGTDSRSTNPDLSLWQDARYALQQHPVLRPTQALSAITDAAAEALHIADHYGSLRPGRVAALNVLPLARGLSDPESLVAQLFENAASPRLIWPITHFRG